MKDFITIIEDFLFDILGLVLPGFIFIITFISPIYFLDTDKIDDESLQINNIFIDFQDVINLFESYISRYNNILLFAILILSYIFGHVVKVFSVIKYEFLTVIFDNSLNKLIINIFNLLLKVAIKLAKFLMKLINLETQVLFTYFMVVSEPFAITFNKIFTFKPPNYFLINEELKKKCIEIINNRLGTNYPDKWYSIFKLSSIINREGNTKSLAINFLVKYNLYRSLSFIFFFYTIYLIYFFYTSSTYSIYEISRIEYIIKFLSALLWFTFHCKYKRYWTLCGNENLVSLFYYLNKNKINES